MTNARTVSFTCGATLVIMVLLCTWKIRYVEYKLLRLCCFVSSSCCPSFCMPYPMSQNHPLLYACQQLTCVVGLVQTVKCTDVTMLTVSCASWSTHQWYGLSCCAVGLMAWQSVMGGHRSAINRSTETHSCDPDIPTRQSPYGNNIGYSPIQKPASFNSNNNNNHNDIYTAIILTELIARVHLVHLVNVEHRQVAANPQTKPPDLGCDSTSYRQLPS